MRVPSAVVVLLLLAGCSGPPAPPAEPAVPDPPEVRLTEIDASVRIAVPEGCNPAFCYMAGSPTLLHAVAMDETATALVLDLGAAGRSDSPVDWEVSCKAPDDEDPACLRVLGRGRDLLPLHLEFLGLQLPPGTLVSLLLAAPSVGDPVADMALQPAWGQSHVTGRVDSVALSPESASPFEFIEMPVAWEGDSGPCAFFVDPECVTTPGAYYPWQNLEGSVVAANLTLTWVSTTPADEVFQLSLRGRCEPSCPKGVVVEGRSPLRIEAEGLDLGDDPYAMIYHSDPTGLEPTGFVFLYTGTKTPFLLEGTLTLRALPPVEA